MKNLIILFVFPTLLCCKKLKAESCKQNEIKNVSNFHKTESIKLKKPLSCQEIVEKIVKSSSLDLKLYKEYFVDIENVKKDSISIHVYFENDLSDDPKQKQIVESTIAWLLLMPNKKKLYDVSVDPENPVELNFDKKIFEENNIFSTCNIEPKETVPFKIH